MVDLANLAHNAAAPEVLREVNVGGSVGLAMQARAAGVRRFVYLSSLKARAPDDGYGRAKREAEAALAGIEGLERFVLRPSLVYGPGVKANILALVRAIARGVPLPDHWWPRTRRFAPRAADSRRSRSRKGCAAYGGLVSVRRRIRAGLESRPMPSIDATVGSGVASRLRPGLLSTAGPKLARDCPDACSLDARPEALRAWHAGAG